MGRTAKRDRARPPIGLALAGGGLEGAIYEIGALRALDEVLEELDFNDFDIYVGVSAGSFLAGNLANGLTTAQMCRALLKHEPGEHPFNSEIFLTPAVAELGRRARRVPGLLWESLGEYLRNPKDKSLLDSLTRLGRALPVGLFDNEPLRRYLETIYHLKDRTDDFRRLGKKLVVVAVDLDSGEAVRFGEPPHDDVPISQAIQASTALPGLYPPVAINGRYYVDGVLVKTVHASVALEAGAQLLLCINPIVPVDTRRAVEQGIMRRGRLIDRGWPTVISQTLRTLIHSRLQAGFASYEGRFGDAQIVLLEPQRDDYRMFFNNIFSFAKRRELCEHAYRATRRELWDRREELEPIFARAGLTLRTDLLADLDRSLWRGVAIDVPPDPSAPTLARLAHALDRLDALLPAAGR